MRSVLGWMGLLAFTFFSASPAIAKSRHRILELGPEQEAARLARGAIERPEIKTTIFPFELKKVAFGSCNFQRKAQNYFGQILGQKPDLWIWAGDIAYTDGLRRNARRHEYRIVKEAPEYARLYKQVPVIGVWDDHDFAGNNLGGWFSQKAVSQRTVLDFLDEPDQSARRTQEGIYWTYRFGPLGRQVRIILLDLRYFRDNPGQNASMLGAEQWAFLEREILQGAPAEYTVIVSSTQVIQTEMPRDRWSQYPIEKARLYQLLAELRHSVVFLSGDVHYGEFNREKRGDVWFEELTSSGLTHAHPPRGRRSNPSRIGSAVGENHYGIVQFFPLQYELRSTVDSRVLGSWESKIDLPR